LREKIEAYLEREKKEWQRTAWLAAQIISCLAGKRIKADDLLPGMFPKKYITKEEAKRELEELKKRLGIE